MTTSVTMEVAEANLDAALDLADELRREKAKVARLREALEYVWGELEATTTHADIARYFTAQNKARAALADTAPECHD